MNEPLNPEVAVFAAVLELPAEQRGAFLDQACAGNIDLRRQVEALLRVHDDAGNFFDKLASVARPTAAEAPVPGSSGTIRFPGIPSEKPGDRIGRYKLLQQIGEGGCGIVYMAEQEEPVRRRVALKVIKLGMDTKSFIARFEAERQALALMDHPNIAKVLEAGATETGRPYFVMELVRGIKITDYCDENNLATAARLALFIQVCQAIQHAHQKGIIHRDIKPSNILVADHDGVPVPKIIDFGIAKATTDQRLTDKTLFTAFEQFIGTPAYMSPEQAKFSGLDIDTRSDIYSLGVLLYELLTGQTPFDTKELLQAGLDEIRRVIREQEPARPSNCLNTMLGADLTAIAKHRKAEPPKLIHSVQGDLDWIVMKALEKDRTRRYDTANGLAADIQRHLANEPVTACPPSSFYRLQKMVQRNKRVVAAATAVVGSLILGLGASTWFLLRERQALQEAAIAHAHEAVLRGKLRESVRQYAEVQSKIREQQPGEDAAALQRRTYDELAKQLGVEAKVLRERLPQFANELKNAPDTSPYERANAAYSTRDYAEAVKWFRKAAEAGDTQAQLRLGFLYAYGDDVDLNYAEAAKWFREAAEAGDAQGQEALAYQYEHGRGVGIDYGEAMRWYRKAAEGGFKLSQIRLGHMYEQGLGVEKDNTEAARWYGNAADAGGRDNLARMAKRQAAEASGSQPRSRWTNSLGMVFVPVPGTSATFSIWDTRVRDFAAFANEAGYQGGWTWSWRHTTTNWTGHWVGGGWSGPELALEPDYPVCGVSWNDAHKFCHWLSEKEHKSGLLKRDLAYRLPTEEEWSVVFGSSRYPWGGQWPPPIGTGNYAGWTTFPGAREICARTTPVGSFPPNAFGLYDVGGNVWQWSEGLSGTNHADGVLRGGGWESQPYELPSTFHLKKGMDDHYEAFGFRCVISGVDPNAAAAELTGKQDAIKNNLRLINAAKKQWALEHYKLNSDTPQPSDIQPYLGRGSAGELPASVDGEVVIFGKVGESAVAQFPDGRRIELQDTPATVPPIRKVADPASTTVDETIPLLGLAGVPLPDAITALAKQANLNIQFDPALLNQIAPDVDVRWQNVTARQALQAVLDNYGWQMTQVPGSLVRIGARDPNAVGPQRTKFNLLENAPANAAAAANNLLLPAIAFNDVSLLDAIRALALQAGLNIQFDPALANGQAVKVTEQWKNLTALQALQALLDIPGWEMTRIPGNPILRIAPKNP